MRRTILIALCSFFLLTHTNSMIMRNNALMSKMVSKFQDKSSPGDASAEPRPAPARDQPVRVVTMMQNVLCRNFPSIPCDVIMQDPALRSLIEKSIQQIKNKKLLLEQNKSVTVPVINSEDLSNFLQVSHTGQFANKKKHKAKKQKKPIKVKNVWSHERQTPVDTKPPAHVRKKIRKFYPHKMKHKDKEISDERHSISVEAESPSVTRKKRRRFSYRGGHEAMDPPVWRIDYMKHGEPEFNVFSLGLERAGADTLRTKLIKQVPNVLMDEDAVEPGERRGVMHSDVYIKKNIVRRKARGLD